MSEKAAQSPSKAVPAKKSQQPAVKRPEQSVAAAVSQNALDDQMALTPEKILALQRTAGNQAVQRLLAQRPGQARVTSAVKAGGGVIQRQFIIDGDEKTGDALKEWIENNVPKNRPDIATVVNMWAGDESYTTNHKDDLAAYTAASKEVDDNVAVQNKAIGKQITTQAPPLAVSWTAHPVWAEWYFSGLEYQDNKTGGWHANRLGLLPGAATDDGVPTRYVEFRRPGAVGTKDVDKMERCIFDLLSGRCWPNAHYDKGYVEITDVPGSVKNKLMQIALSSTGLLERWKNMKPQEKVVAGMPFGIPTVKWLLENPESVESVKK